MTVQDYLRLVRRHWVIVLIGLVLGLAAGGGGSLLISPQYQASAKLFVSTQSSGTNSDLLQGGNFAQQRVRSYADVATSPEVLAPVIDTLHLDSTPQELAGRVRAAAQTDTVLLSITTTDSSPDQAVRITDAVAAQLVATIDELERPESGPSPVKATVVQPAATPTAPVTPDIPRNAALGGILGLLLGVGIALLRETLDTKVRTESDLRELTDTTFLGSLPFDADATKRPLVTQGEQASVRAELTRQLRTNLQFVDASSELQTLLLTSSIPGEGKSLTAVNLAIVFAETGRRVCIVEADLRRPKAAEYLGVEGGIGLTNVLVGQVGLDDVLQPWQDSSVSVLSAGHRPPNPSELLGSQAMSQLLDQLRERFDTIIIDAPPLLPVTDAAVLSTSVDGVLLVVGSGRAEGHGVTKSLEALAKVNARVVGVVLNLAKVSGRGAYYSYRYDAQPTQLLPKQRGRRGKQEPSRKRLHVAPSGKRRGSLVGRG